MQESSNMRSLDRYNATFSRVTGVTRVKRILQCIAFLDWSAGNWRLFVTAYLSLAMGSSNSLLRGLMANKLVTPLRLRGDLDYGEQAPQMNSCSLERPWWSNRQHMAWTWRRHTRWHREKTDLDRLPSWKRCKELQQQRKLWHRRVVGSGYDSIWNIQSLRRFIHAANR